jgi:hypothetical protein
VAEVIGKKLEAKKWSPNTCKIYLNSVKKFNAYLKSPWVAGVGEEIREKLSVIETCLAEWNRSLTKVSNQGKCPWSKWMKCSTLMT